MSTLTALARARAAYAGHAVPIAAVRHVHVFEMEHDRGGSRVR